MAPLLLGPGRVGELLGSSAAGVYVHFDSSDVMALLPASSVRLPLAMVIAGGLPPIDTDVSVSVGEGMLRLGPDRWTPSRWFDPRPRNLTAADPGRLTAAARVLFELSPAEAGVAVERAVTAVAALVDGEARLACALLGEGPGLTPAGDDVVAGALAAGALLGDGRGLDAVPEILAHARVATTSLSAALLSCAADGQIVPEAAHFLAALGGTGEVASALASLRSVGSTSGTALAVGIVAALHGRGGGGVRDDPVL